jgi:hypothetical protein
MKKAMRATPARFGPSQPALIPVSCPDCSGVLSVKEEGLGPQRLYVCQVKHRHSTTSLYQAMEERAENILWSAAVTLKQLGDVYETLLAGQPAPGGVETKKIKRRLREVRAHHTSICEMIEDTHILESTR